MGESGNGELIEFGGLGDRWPFKRVRRPPMPHLPPAMRVRASRASVTIALAALVVGLVAGFFGGRLTAHKAGPTTTSITRVSSPIVVIPQFASAAIEMTGPRCAVQVGNNLQLGLEIRNQTSRAVTLGAIRLMFPLGGLRMISSGFGPCGALPALAIPPAASLPPGTTEWIHATVAVAGGCPQPLPVWFKVGYSAARTTGIATLAGFPDLGPVSYRHCRGSTQNFSSIVIATVNPGSRHSSRR